eukprot:7855134-Pyramimonas_sp.AAC.1
MFRFRSRFGGYLRRFAGFSTLRGAAGWYFIRPVFAGICGDVPSGLAMFLFQHVSLSEQIWRMYQAIRWFQHSKGSGGGVFHWAPIAGFCGDISC